MSFAREAANGGRSGHQTAMPLPLGTGTPVYRGGWPGHALVVAADSSFIVPRSSFLFLLALTVCPLALSAPVDLPFKNTEFEAAADRDGKPDGWHCKIAEPQAVSLDTEITRAGAASLRIRQIKPKSYSYAMQGIENEWPGRRMVASVWIKAESISVRGIGPRLYCGYEGGLCHAARGPVLDETGSCDWQQVLVPFNTRDKKRVEIYLYLHESTGAIWFDDLRVTPAPFEAAVASLSAAPVVDGSANDEAWADAAPQNMVWLDDGSPTSGRTVRLGHDATHVFALVQVPAHPTDAPAASIPAKGPHITLALDPEAAGERALAFHLAPDGRRWTSAANDARPTDDWEGVARQEGEVCTAEFAIPVGILSPTLRTGHHWRLNVVDHRPGARDAELIFTGQDRTLPALFADAQLPKLRLARLRQAQAKARLTRIIEHFGRLAKALNIDSVPDKFEGKKAAGEGLDDVGRGIEEASRQAATLRGDADEQWRALDERLAALTADLDRLQSQTRPVAAYSLARKHARKPTWSVVLETPMRKVLQDAKLLTGLLTDTIELSAARGEGEAVQLVVLPLTKDVENVQVVLPKALAGPGRAIIPRSALELNTVGYVRCEKPAYPRPADSEWWPDALLPYAPVSVKKGEVRPFWLTVWVPRDARPGVYHGKIVLTAKGAHAVSVKLKLRVYDFELPVRPACRSSFGLGSSWISRYYFGDKDARKHIDGPTFQRWCKELLRHRISPYLACEFRPTKGDDGKYAFEPWEDNIAYCVENGLTSMLLTIMPATPGQGPDYDDAFERQFRADIGAAYERLKQRNWLDLAFICAWDEPHAQAYPGVLAGHRLIRETCPGIKVLQTVCYDSEPGGLIGDVDIWCPITSRWNPDFYHQRQAAGEEVWWYVCCGPHPPHATFFIDEDAIDHRMLFWQTWRQGVAGVLFWQTTWWEGNVKPGGTKEALDPAKWVNASHRVFKVNGDGHLLYPGKDLAPLSSLRLALIRDGVEDYDYFALLREALKDPKLPEKTVAEAKALLELGPEFSRSMTRFCKSPRTLQERRNEIAEKIERLCTLRQAAPRTDDGPGHDAS